MKRLVIAVCVPTVLLLAACGGASTTAGSSTATGSAAPSATSGSGAASPSASGSTLPTSTPSPSVTPIAPEDLIEGFPTGEDISKAQGSRFTAKEDFPVWTQALPLSKKHADQTFFGDVASTRPQKCVNVTWFYSGGVSHDVATSDLIKAAGFSNNSNTNQYLGRKIYNWQTIGYILPPGAAPQFLTNLKALSKECAHFKAVSISGDVSSWGLASNNARNATSGEAFVIEEKPANGGRTRSFYIVESIGNVLYDTWVLTDSSKLPGVNALYNERANKLAALQGVTRPDIDLGNLQSFTPDPSTFKEIPVNGEGST